MALGEGKKGDSKKGDIKIFCRSLSDIGRDSKKGDTAKKGTSRYFAAV
jgi:hypothetical protein